jgi:hypothetical protein
VYSKAASLCLLEVAAAVDGKVGVDDGNWDGEGGDLIGAEMLDNCHFQCH